MISLAGKVVLVTGGASGLGKATAERLAENGCKVAILDLPESQGAKVASGIGDARCLFCPCHVTSASQAESAMAEIVRKWGKLDVAVNCAGCPFFAKIYNHETNKTHELEDFRRIVDVNLTGTFNIARLAAKEMAKNPPESSGERGVIVNTSSGSAYYGVAGTTAYCASKGALVSMTLPMARDLAPLGIRVITVAPGNFDTAMFQSVSESIQIAALKDNAFPLRLGYAEEFAQCVQTIVHNRMFNATTVSLDAGLRR